MTAFSLPELVEVKASLLARGVSITGRAVDVLSRGGTVPLTIHEYATTGGVTLRLAKDVFVNAPFDEWYCAQATSTLDVEDGAFVLRFQGRALPVEVLPLPGYLGERDEKGRLVSDVIMSHTDRARISPIGGCVFSCEFCDLAATRTSARPLEQLLSAIEVARRDHALPIHHLLISGGTPAHRDHAYFEDACAGIAHAAGMPVDVMMAPWDTPDHLDRMVDAGVHGFAINLEVFDSAHAAVFAREKARIGHGRFRDSIRRAVDRTGGKGRVRSLLVAGIEPMESTLAGVEWLAREGCDPVLSPFRPTRGTPLATREPPSAADLVTLLERASAICADHGVVLGPRCIPCQHNTLTLPWGRSYVYT